MGDTSSWFPENASSYGADLDSLILLIFYIVGAWFFLVEGILLWLFIAYRKKKGRRASYVTGASLASLSWVLVPCLLIFGFDLAIDAAGASVWRNVKETLPPPDMTIRVIGKQFAWDFVHPGVDGELDTDDDITSEYSVNVPAERVVHFELQSEDVVHSLWLPHFRLKQDAVPGRTIKGWFEATSVGEFPIACAELCGLGHTTMRGLLRVQTIEEHTKWVGEQELASEFWDE